jgi:hypothetical protein
MRIIIGYFSQHLIVLISIEICSILDKFMEQL